MRGPPPHPFVRLSPRMRRAALLVLAPLTFTIMFALISLDAELRTPASPAGIVSFELAGDGARAGQILDAWGSRGRRAAARSLHLDFLYLASYAPALALLCAAAASKHAKRGRSEAKPSEVPEGRPSEGGPPQERAFAHPRLAALGAWLAWGQLAAGVLDALENLALLQVLGGASGDFWPAFAAACAWPKFALVGACFAYLIGFATLHLLRNAR